MSNSFNGSSSFGLMAEVGLGLTCSTETVSGVLHQIELKPRPSLVSRTEEGHWSLPWCFLFPFLSALYSTARISAHLSSHLCVCLRISLSPTVFLSSVLAWFRSTPSLHISPPLCSPSLFSTLYFFFASLPMFLSNYVFPACLVGNY